MAYLPPLLLLLLRETNPLESLLLVHTLETTKVREFRSNLLTREAGVSKKGAKVNRTLYQHSLMQLKVAHLERPLYQT